MARSCLCVLIVFLASSLVSSEPDFADSPGYKASGSSLYRREKYSFEEEDVDKGGTVSKACRYDEAEWSDCDSFELIRFRVLHLLHGGRQCEEVKNITKHCTPEELPPGTRWLIGEHRKCIAELKRLKGMIAELAKYIAALHGKGRSLLNAYMALKKHLDELREQIDALKQQNDQKRAHLAALRAAIEDWKSKARDLQTELDDLRTKYHDLTVEHKEMGERLKESKSERIRCLSENERLRKKMHDLDAENSELKRRLLAAEKFKEQLRESKYSMNKLEYKMEKLQDHQEAAKDQLAQCKLDMLNVKDFVEEQYTKDTHVDLAMDMWIVHNKSKVSYSASSIAYPTTPLPYFKPRSSKCLITYYGYTNETCWYETRDDEKESGYSGTLGHHLVEAHWKYFTVNVRDPYECDRAAKRHYDFLLKRCSPRHYLPVISVFRPEDAEGHPEKELSAHIYPKPNIPQPGHPHRCWVTYLGGHGQCEAHVDKYSLYNSDDTPDGYKKGAGSSKSICLSRAANWRSYCKTPVMVMYVPDGVATNWLDRDIQHDTHGSRMFEDEHEPSNKINPESINPHKLQRPQEKKHVEYEDTPEYRKSLNMKGSEREAILNQLRRRLGLAMLGSGQTAPPPNPNNNRKVQWHEGKMEHIKASTTAATTTTSTATTTAAKAAPHPMPNGMPPHPMPAPHPPPMTAAMANPRPHFAHAPPAAPNPHNALPAAVASHNVPALMMASQH